MLELMPADEFVKRFLASLTNLNDGDLDLHVFKRVYRPSVPRFSSLGNCAREQYYDLVPSEGMETDLPHNNSWANLMGTMGQAVAAAALRDMGYVVDKEDEEAVIGDTVAIGHPDGRWTGLDLGEAYALWDNKVKNLYALHNLLTKGLPVADPSIYLQIQAGMMALDADVGIVTAMPFDISAFRLEIMTKRKLVAPDATVHRIVIQSDEFAQELVLSRASTIGAAVLSEMLPAREANPELEKFPCTYCKHRVRCLMDGEKSDLFVSPLPDSWRS